MATDKQVFSNRLAIVSESAGLERERLLKWIMAWAALSATWMLNDGLGNELDLCVAPLAAQELSRL